jgi:nucleotide-binding universal stress UspA family protein
MSSRLPEEHADRVNGRAAHRDSLARRPPWRAQTRILLALSEREFPAAALLRAAALARLLGAELHAVRVMPRPARRIRIFRPTAARALSALQSKLMISRATRRWLAGLGEPLPAGRFKLCDGAFVEQVAARAAQLSASLIVISPDAAGRGPRVTALARLGTRAVLVARERSRASIIMAATDLRLPGYPVLRNAEKLGRRLEASLIALHNVSPQRPYVSPLAGGPVVLPASEADQDARRLRLLEATRDFTLDPEPVLTHERDAVDAILAVASQRDVDMIVVGSRPRPLLRRLFSGGVAARVVRRAGRSVLVVPLHAAEPAGRRASL